MRIQDMNVGFVGLGRMGYHMAVNLLNAGFSLKLWNRNKQTAINLQNSNKAYDIEIVSNLKELSNTCDVVITMLQDDKASYEVYFAQDGLFSFDNNCNKKKVFIESGTMSPKHISSLVQMEQKLPVKIIDAPVSGSTLAAQEGKLTFMLGCKEDEGKYLQPLFEAMGQQIFYFDKAGTGSTMKVVVNAILYGFNQSISEGLLLAKANNIDPEKAFDVLENSAVAAPMLKYRRNIYLDKEETVTFTMSLARKDMQLAMQLINDNRLHSPQFKLNLKTLEQAESEGFSQKDMGSLVNFIYQKNNL